MDAAEIVRLRAKLEANVRSWTKAEKLSLLEALEQARKERDEAIALNEKALGAGGVLRLLAQRDAAQQDAKDARALLGDVDKWLSQHTHATYLRARIEAMLEKKL